jgi:hypothetical protein
MINLTEKEKSEILKISKNFVEIHQRIMKVEEKIKELESESASLIGELESCRDNEFRFVSELSDKYGEGNLDPFTLTWMALESKKENV